MLDLFTVIWGSEMLQCYLDITLPSLMQPDNVLKAKNLLGDYTIYTDDETRAAIQQSGNYHRLRDCIEVVFVPLQKGSSEVNSNILYQLKRSAAVGHYMLVLSPDWALGNGSLFNMAELCAKGEYNPILYGFPRVTEAGYQALRGIFSQGRPVSNRELVSLAMKHIEQTTYKIGVAMQHWILSNNTWMVGHNVPTPCLRPDDEIIKIFSTNTTLNSGFDHAIPYILVEKGYPWHMISHSDIYFQVERGRHLITESVFDRAMWQTDKALKGLLFFDKLKDQVWQGV